MRNFISIITIAFVIISCSHGITPHFPTGRDLFNPAEIIIIRNRNLLMGAWSVTIFLDGLPIAHVRRGEYVSVPVQPGEHHIRVIPGCVNAGSIADIFEEGKKYYLLISISEPWDWEPTFLDSLIILGTLGKAGGGGCDFEIEKISEEKGLKRIRNSKHLTKIEEEYKTTAEATAKEAEKPK